MTGPAELVTCDQTIEHTVRFAKQTLGWTTPRPRHPEQADRWTWLVLTCYAQLRLAREVAGDQRLPWERPRPQPRLSPMRVRRGVPQLLVRLGSPAAAPKPAGRSPGRPKAASLGQPAPSGDQEADQEPPQEADHNRRGRLTRPTQHHTDAEQGSGLSSMPTRLNHKLRRLPVAG
jgi:hypothetical protein